MVDKRLGFSRALRNAERVEEQFFDNLEVRLRVEGGIEREKRPRALQAVASEVQLFHGMHCIQPISVLTIVSRHNATHNFAGET